MRSLWIKIHLSIAAFFAPVLILMATSGGLYLLDQKGSVESSTVVLSSALPIDPDGDLEMQVARLLQANQIDHKFEYIKVSGHLLVTRPTTRTWYEVDTSGPSPSLTRHHPDLIKGLIELHKGHGPTLFKNLQKVMAAGLLVVLLSGLWLGLSSPNLRMQALAVAGAGLVFSLSAALL